MRGSLLSVIALAVLTSGCMGWNEGPGPGASAATAAAPVQAPSATFDWTSSVEGNAAWRFNVTAALPTKCLTSFNTSFESASHEPATFSRIENSEKILSKTFGGLRRRPRRARSASSPVLSSKATP